MTTTRVTIRVGTDDERKGGDDNPDLTGKLKIEVNDERLI
jgi:hypothetical protein